MQTMAAPAPVEVPERPPLDVTWHAVDLRSGRRGPQVTVTSPPTIGRLIGEHTSAQVDVLMWDETNQQPVPGWDAGTLPGRSMLVACDNDDYPLWGGMVLRRRAGLVATTATVDTVTLEAYFDRRYVGDHDWVNEDAATVVASGVLADGTPLGIGFTIDAQPANNLIDAAYSAYDDKTIASVLGELIGLDGGPEFTVDLAWTDETHTVLERTVRVRRRIGRNMALPAAVFTMPGPVVDGQFVEDYSSEHGANDVLPSSSGEGLGRPRGSHSVAQDLLDSGWAKFEHRFSPGTNIDSIAKLNSHSRQRLAEMRDGLKELTLEAHLDAGPRVGTDFDLGDDVAVNLTCPRFPARRGPDGDMLPGYTTVVRCTGWDIDLGQRRLKPRLLEVG